MNRRVRKVMYSDSYSQVWGKDMNGKEILLLDGTDVMVDTMIVMRGLQVMSFEQRDVRHADEVKDV